MKGLYDDSSGEKAYVYGDQDHFEATHLYLHGWSHPSNATTDLAEAFECANNSGGTCAATYFDNSVVDGSDTSEDMFWGTYGGGVERVFNNYYRYTSGAMVTNFNFFYGNTVEYPVYSFDRNHGNAVFNFGPLSGNYMFIYDNVIRHTQTCSGCVNLWFAGNSGPNSAYVGYGFNNVMYDLNPSNVVDYTPSSGSGSNYGTYYLFNNTIECGNDTTQVGCTWGTNGAHPFTLYMVQNHWITSSSVCSPGTCPNESGDLVQTVAQADADTSPHFDQYTSSQTYAFSTVASTNSTVGNGTNLQSYCTTLSSLDPGAGTACQSDTAYGVGYNTTNHTVIVPDRTTNARPASAAWDIGAYQFQSATSLSPPSSVTAVPH
jgi:hypothetical protein